MIRTVVLIGEFFGELNWLKDAIRKLGPDFRCVSFTDRESGVNLLLKDIVLNPDFIVVDDTMPPSLLPILKTVERPDRKKDACLILFSRRQPDEPRIHPALKIREFYKSADKKKYVDMLRSVVSEGAYQENSNT
jgi:hypothetical protein